MITALCLCMLLANPTEGWNQANEAYRQGDYALALTQYEALYKAGVRNGKLHYNLGNAYLKNNQLGNAILHYAKARKLMPSDADIQNNLKYAESLRLDPPIEGEDQAFADSFNTLVHQAPYSLIFNLAFAFLLLGGVTSLILVVRPHTGKWAGYCLVIGCVLGLSLTGVAFVQHRQLTRSDYAVILKKEVDVRSGPATRETISFTIHEGIRCIILDQTDGWCRIGLANGYNGWVPRTALGVI